MTVVLKPQPGPQEMFLASPADIAIYGGAAGGGKSWALLIEPLRHAVGNKNFNAVLFRRTLADAKKPGGTWKQTERLYSLFDATSNLSAQSWQFKGGGQIVIAGIEHEKDVFNWQGAEIPLLLFDELTHFTAYQFWYMLSRNRSLCGVRPYIRATTNPDSDSWVARLIEWWIDQDTGYAIPERSGVIRWFARINDCLEWADTKEELIEKHGPETLPKSLTFVPANIHDNKILLKADPGYLANLRALQLVERARLEGGNWKIRPAAGLYFKREWCEVVDAVPAQLEIVRYWDMAATQKTDNNDPDWSASCKLGKDTKTGLFYWLHTSKMRETSFKVEQAIKNTASADGLNVRLKLPQDPGQAGKSQAGYLTRQLAGVNVSTSCERGDKIVRFSPFSAQCEAGNVKVLRGEWNDSAFEMLEGFPDIAHDDIVDACSGAFSALAPADGMGLFGYMREQAAKVEASQAKFNQLIGAQ